MIESSNAHPNIYVCAYTCLCVYMCVSTGHCRNTGGAWTCFQLKAEAPTTKGLAGGVVTRRISFFFGPCDLPFLRFTFKAALAGRSPRALHLWWKERMVPSPPLPYPSPASPHLPSLLRLQKKKEREKRTEKKEQMPPFFSATVDKRSMDVLEAIFLCQLKLWGDLSVIL